MKSSRAILVAFFSLLFIFTPTVAHSIDIPLLTWERGKEQNLVLGGNTDNEWKIELINDANEVVLEFRASDTSLDGFIVYSAPLPRDLPLGAYAVKATGFGVPESIVAGVNIVELSFFELVQIPFELLWILLGYIFITANFNLMRLRKYSTASLREFPELDPDLNAGLLFSLYRLRDRATQNLNPSTFQLVLRREGELLRSRSLTLWCYAPIVSFVIGFVAGIQILLQGGFGVGPWVLIAVGVLLSTIDLYSGLIAFAGLVLSHLIFGDVVSLRDVMVLLAVALGWSGAYFFASMLMLLRGQDSSIKGTTRRGITDALYGGFAAAVTFHSVQILVLSLVVNVNDSVATDWRISALVGILISAKFYLRLLLEDGENIDSVARITMFVGRVVSPKSVSFLFVFFAGTFYIWIRDWVSALILATSLSAPYFLLLIRFSGPVIPLLRSLSRFPLIESLVVSGLAYLIFVALEDLPYGVLERSRLFLILGVIPVLLHSLYTMLWDISDRKDPEVETNEIQAGGR